MNRAAAFLRAIRGPLMLITLGSLLALARFQDISFGKSWPVLLIMLGLLKLAERVAMRAPAQHSAG